MGLSNEAIHMLTWLTEKGTFFLFFFESIVDNSEHYDG